MNQRIKISILISVVLASLVLASFAFAQTPAPANTLGITKADMAAVVAKETALQTAIKSGDNAKIDAARMDAMKACVDLGNRALQITKGGGSGHLTLVSTLWGDPNGPCAFGFWLTKDGGTDILARNNLRKDRVSIATDPVISGLRDAILGGAILDKAAVDKSNAQATGGAAGGGSSAWDMLSTAIGWVLTFIANILTAILLAIASVAGMILNWSISQSGGAIQPSLVQVGWTIVRDLMNMFFILALIVMALATILRLGDEYNYKHLLPKLVIMALLINFSKVIADTLINFSNFLTQMFVPANGFSDYGQFFSGLVTRGQGLAGFFSSGTGGASAALTDGILKVVSALVITASFVAIAGLLFIRIIGLWVIIVLSPAAFALRILPSTEQYAEEIFHAFIKYLVWAPVAVFFLRLGQLLIATIGSGTLTTNTMFDFAFASAFMWAAVIVAQKAGMVGGDMIVNGVKRGFKGAGKLAWTGVKAGANLGAEEYLKRTGREIRPAKWLEGWKESREINRQARETAGMVKALEKGSALASPTTFFQRYMGKGAWARLRGGGQEKAHEYQEEAKRLRETLKAGEEAGSLTNEEKANLIEQIRASEALGQKLQNPEDYFTQKKIRHAMDEEKKNIHTDNWHELVDMFNSAVGEGKQARASAILMHLTDTYNENELINKTRYTEAMSDKESADGKAHAAGEFFEYSTAGAENFRKQILDKKLGLGDQGSKLIMSDVSDLAENRGHRTLMRMYETEHGRLVKKSEKDIQNEQAAENAKMDDSKVLRDGHRLMYYNEVPDKDYDINGKRSTVITPAGLTYYITNYQAVKNRVNRNEMNASQAKAAAQNAKAIFAAAANIHDDKEKEEYLQTMSALVDFGESKMAEAGEDSRLDTVYNRFTGNPPSPLTEPGEHLNSIPGYVRRDQRPYLSDKGGGGGKKAEAVSERLPSGARNIDIGPDGQPIV